MSVGSATSTGADFALTVSISITNVGSLAGAEVVQLFLEYPPLPVTTPRLQLKGFRKTGILQPGQSQTVIIQLDKYSVSYWDTEEHAWRSEPGCYHVCAGSSIHDLGLSGKFTLSEGFSWTGI